MHEHWCCLPIFIDEVVITHLYDYTEDLHKSRQHFRTLFSHKMTQACHHRWHITYHSNPLTFAHPRSNTRWVQSLSAINIKPSATLRKHTAPNALRHRLPRGQSKIVPHANLRCWSRSHMEWYRRTDDRWAAAPTVNGKEATAYNVMLRSSKLCDNSWVAALKRLRGGILCSQDVRG